MTALIQAVLGFLGALLGLRREVKAEEAGKAQERAATQGVVINDVQVAQQARGEVERSFAVDPDKLREPDEFTRPN